MKKKKLKVTGNISRIFTKLASGIPGFDEISRGGIPKGRTTLVSGTSGSGKTVFAAQFLHGGVVQGGENGVFVTFEERPVDIIKNMKSFGWDIAKLVKEKIDELGGTVRVDSEHGKGTNFIMKLPLTLAIIKALLVGVGTEAYAIPATNVVKSISVNPKNIKRIENQEMIILNKEESIPFFRLNKLFNIETEEKENEEIIAVIVRKGDNFFGLGVDSLLAEQEIIIKPLTTILKGYRGFAGFTILGTGKVVLILDVGGLA